MAKAFGGITAIKGNITGFVRDTLGTNMDIVRGTFSRAGRKGFGGLRGATEAFFGFGSMSQVEKTMLPGIRRGSSTLFQGGQWVTQGLSGAQRHTARDAVLLGRRAGGGAAIGAAALGVSMLTGYSVFDQAQAGVGGYIGAKAAGRAGLWGGGFRGKALGVGMTAAAGLGGQALGAQEWALGGMGYGAASAYQGLMGNVGRALIRKGPFKGLRIGPKTVPRLGGAWGRAAGAAVGVGLGLII